MSTLQTAVRSALRSKALRQSQASHDVRRNKIPGVSVNSFKPLDLWSGGDKGVLCDAGVEGALFTDTAKTAVAATENDVIAAYSDLSGNNVTVQKVNTTQRPKLALSANNYRRRWEYDGVDDAMTVSTPSMGSDCTVFRSRPALGGFITGNVTIGGSQTDNTTAMVLGIINRALTGPETTMLQLYLNQRSGKLDEFNVPYGPDTTNEILDVFHASGHAKGPIIFMVHGGAWRTGSKQSPNVVKNKLQHYLIKGFTVVSVNYKLDVGTDPLDQAASVSRALAYVQANAASWGCDPRQIVVMGHSAGAHLTTLMSSKSYYRSTFNLLPWLGNIVIDSAAYNVPLIMANPGHLSLYDEPWGVGDTAHQIAGSPSLVLDCCGGPMLLITSTDTNPDESDGLAGPFRDLYLARGGYAEVYSTDFVHADTNINLGLMVGAAPIAYTNYIDAFMLNYLKV